MRKGHDYELMDRYKDMKDGEYIDGEFVEYEDMTDEQLMEIFAEDAEEIRKEYQEEWYERYTEEM